MRISPENSTVAIWPNHHFVRPRSLAAPQNPERSLKILVLRASPSDLMLGFDPNPRRGPLFLVHISDEKVCALDVSLESPAQNKPLSFLKVCRHLRRAASSDVHLAHRGSGRPRIPFIITNGHRFRKSLRLRREFFGIFVLRCRSPLPGLGDQPTNSLCQQNA